MLPVGQTHDGPLFPARSAVMTDMKSVFRGTADQALSNVSAFIRMSGSIEGSQLFRGHGGILRSIARPRGEVMPNDDELAELLRRAKAGENAAIRDFLAQFEQEVRTMVRSRLPKKLRTQFDSTDFVQSVWQSFFVDSDSREFATVEHLRGFLFGMVRNKVREQHRRLTRTEKYDLAREERLYVRRGRPRRAPRGRFAGSVAESGRAGLGSHGTIDGRPQPAGDRSAHAPPAGPYLCGDRRAHRAQRANGAPGDRRPSDPSRSLADGTETSGPAGPGLAQSEPIPIRDLATVLDGIHRRVGARSTLRTSKNTSAVSIRPILGRRSS